jgi:dTDP-4-dehydrorhamnose reductase
MWETNVHGTSNVGTAAREVGAAVLLISSDAVFDGLHPPYHPCDEPSPVTEYGRAKHAAERALAARNDSYAVLRVPLLYGPVRMLEETSVTALAIPLLRRTSTRVDATCRRYPTHVNDVARACAALIREPLCGQVWHFGAPAAHTKFEMAMIIADTLGAPHDLLLPERPEVLPHPYDAALAQSQIADVVAADRFASSIGEILNPFVR